jgi:2-oxoglutarate dehydrogenase E1 component
MLTDLRSLAGNLAYVDEMYARYREDPATVDGTWRQMFELGQAVAEVTPGGVPISELARLSGVAWLVNAYRSRGHLEADLDPLGMFVRAPHPDLDPATYGYTEADMDRVVPSGGFGNVPERVLRDLIARLRATYCGTIGLEYMHISAPVRKSWLAERMEQGSGYELDRETQIGILEQLVAAEGFERFLHAKYIGTKRFSLEGSETLIPLLELVLEQAARSGVEEAVIGMAHRGRLNVLVHTMGKKPSQVFTEFEDIDAESSLGSGDVKYHMGYSCDRVIKGRTLHLSLAFNPSHLEAVDPVVVGRVRAKQRRRHDFAHAKVLGILLHGDAAFAGQGLVPETLNLTELHGYRTGGTVHVIVNNQIGFTTSPQESRSTPYATDVAKMIQCPIFHVNGEDPDAVARVIHLAMDYRDQFKSDVVIDMFCYRKYGHNEADEPSFTQPLLYRKIERKESIFSIYSRRLIAQGVVTEHEVMDMAKRLQTELEHELEQARAAAKRPEIEALLGVWEGYVGGADSSVPDVDTGVPRARLEEITERAIAVPEGFHPNPKIARLFKTRLAMGKGEQSVDWGMGEILAYGSLLWDGTLVRLSGQDSCRGTFSHRHAVVVDSETGEEHTPLAHLHAHQGECRIYDSPLSEAAVLGFEFGYSLDYPDGLVIWEAQFGDFVNGAQVILDQFVSSSEDKWKRLSGLVMLLPHGYEGQGPEHSSARFERFLQLAAEDNLQVVNPTTPAQMFHLLRRQVLRRWRKPLVVLTPKSLLRHPAAVSPLSDLTEGRFQRILGDDLFSPHHGTSATMPASDVRRVMLCSGKIFYELSDERRKRGDRTTAILRLEQIYPWRDEFLTAALAQFPRASEIVWVQDEPANMGAWFFVEPRLRRLVGASSLRAVTRAESASPATGSSKAHGIEQRNLFAEAFGK